MNDLQGAKERIGNAPIKAAPGYISGYDTVYIMSPIYWGTYAPEVETALRALDFSGKKIRVITTHRWHRRLTIIIPVGCNAAMAFRFQIQLFAKQHFIVFPDPHIGNGGRFIISADCSCFKFPPYCSGIPKHLLFYTPHL